MKNPRNPGDSPGGLERREILDTLARLRDRPPPTDPSAVGWIAAIVAIVTLALLPFVGPGLGLGGRAMIGIGLGLGLVGLLGVALGIYGSAFFRGAVVADVQEAIQELIVEWPDGDPTVIREAAIRILDGSTVST